MNFWKMIYIRWDESELKKWTSFRKTAYLLIPLLIYFVVHDAAEILLALGAGLAGENFLLFFAGEENTLQAILSGLAALIGTAAVYPALKGELAPDTEKEKDTDTAPDTGKSGINTEKVTNYCWLAALAFCLAVGLNIFFYQSGLGGRSENYEQVRLRQYGVNFLIGVVLYGVISPLAEETVFRGILYNRMKRCFGYSLALIVSSLLFGAYHGNWVQTLYGGILGLVIAYTYGLYESFAAPLLFHAVANISVYTLTYRDSLGSLDRRTIIILGMVVLLAAALVFRYITKKLMKMQDRTRVVRKHH